MEEESHFDVDEFLDFSDGGAFDSVGTAGSSNVDSTMISTAGTDSFFSAGLEISIPVPV